MNLIKNLQDKYIIICGGKGGTGKTTTAAAIALELAKNRRVIVISTDPAHSLSDAFGVEIGPNIKTIEIKGTKLDALEFNPQSIMSASFEKLEEKFPLMSDEFSLETLSLMMDTAMLPVEYVEGAVFIVLLDKINKLGKYDTIVFDTAPTGHTLKLLKLPELMSSFLMKIMRFQMKIASFFSKLKSLFGFESYDIYGETLKMLDQLRRIIEENRKLLTDKKRTEFVIVCIPTILSLYETIRLSTELETLGVPNNTIIVNMVRITSSKETCSFCKNLSKLHFKVLEEIKRTFPDKSIYIVPFLDYEPRAGKLFHFTEFLKISNQG